MKLSKLVRKWVAAATCYSLLSVQLVHAAGTPGVQSIPQSPATVRDVALGENGVLRGQVLDVQGIPLQGVPVSVSRLGEEIARTQTDARGSFVAQGLTGGICTVTTPVGTGVYRVWSPRTAPPAATQAALIVPDESVMRGQFGTGALGWLANPWVLAAIVAAAIAIPLALDNDDDAS